MSRVTISEVAKEAGVSTMTVSRVVNGKGSISPKTEAQVRRAIETLGYRPSRVARSLTTDKTNTLGLIIPDIGNPFYPEIMAGAEEAAWRAGYSLILYNSNEQAQREKEALELLEDMRVDGLILASSRLPEDDLFAALQRHRAVVLINRFITAPKVASVRVDDAYGTMLAVNHLWTTGHQHIGFVGGPESAYSTQARRSGFITAFETRGLEVEPRYIVYSQPQERAGKETVKRLLCDRPELTALICYNDLVAIGALQAAFELGKRVPKDLSIVGCDDIRMASLVNPSLTTLGVSNGLLGVRAIELLLALMKGEAEEKHLWLKPKLIVRQSAPQDNVRQSAPQRS